ncbi:DUF72 domain-containing protein, partial [Burkholderia thailandensis]|nr:DUF72 domain-containing protein [Burkholderia thailandensis]
MGDGSTRRKPAPPRQDDARSDQFDLFGGEPLPPAPASADSDSAASSAGGSGAKRKRATAGKPRGTSRDVAAPRDALQRDGIARSSRPPADPAPGANDRANGESDGTADARANSHAHSHAGTHAKPEAAHDAGARAG